MILILQYLQVLFGVFYNDFFLVIIAIKFIINPFVTTFDHINFIDIYYL